MPTDKKTIRSYNSYATQWAKRMRSGNNTAHRYLEKPAMHQKLPNLKGKVVLCIGCGTGEECAHLKKLGAKRVVGVDISKGVIAEARKSYPGIEFHVMDLEKLKYPAGTFDFIYSSLTLHYIKEWLKPLQRIHKTLKKGGVFLFSAHHPLYWGSKIARSQKVDTVSLGYTRYESGATEVWGDYFKTRRVDDVWFKEFKVTFYHRPLAAIMSDIMKSGFTITDVVEPRPTTAAAKANAAFYKIHTKIPLFIIFKLEK